MKKLLILPIGALMTRSVTREMSRVSDQRSFNQFVDRYYVEYLVFSPLEATQIADVFF